MPGRFLAAVVGVFALALTGATSVAAVSITFDGEVLRYRGQQREDSHVVVRLKASAEPRYLQIRADRTMTFHLGSGCHRSVSDPTHVVHCPLVPRQN